MYTATLFDLFVQFIRILLHSFEHSTDILERFEYLMRDCVRYLFDRFEIYSVRRMIGRSEFYRTAFHSDIYNRDILRRLERALREREREKESRAR